MTPRTAVDQQPPDAAAARSIQAWLGRARRRLWLRRAIPPAVLSLCVAAAIVCAAVALASAVGPGITLGLIVIAPVVLLIGGGIALRRRPSLLAAARTVDAEVGLRERLITAAELIAAEAVGPVPAGPVAAQQLAATAALLARVSPRRAISLGGAFRPVAVGLAGLAALAGMALIVSIGAAPAATAPIARGGVPSAADPAQAPEVNGPPAPLNEPRPRSVDDPEAELAESRRQQEALDRLADALGGTAAARDIADALRSGDTERAAKGLEDLARENDQLSQPARDQLTRALQSAAANPSSGGLAQAERSAAQGLTSKDYRRTEQGLRDLAEAVRRGGQQQTPYEDLARALRESGAAQPRPGAPGEQPAPAGSGQPGAQPGSGGGGKNQGVGPGAGNAPADLRPETGNTRLGVDGVPLELDPGRPDGSGRAPDPNAPPPIRVQRGSVSTGYSGGGGGEAASSDPVDVVDTNRQVPVDTRGAVREYFTPEERR